MTSHDDDMTSRSQHDAVSLTTVHYLASSFHRVLTCMKRSPLTFLEQAAAAVVDNDSMLPSDEADDVHH